MPNVANIHPKGVKVKRSAMPNKGQTKPLGAGKSSVKNAGKTKTNDTSGKSKGLRVAVRKGDTAKPKHPNST
jgi:hypothetical protein